MRIIRGKYRGHLLHPPRNLKARPTTDRAREALFNILENNFLLEDATVLDLFSGTGSISYEFASRGTSSVVLVEQNPVHYKFILKTIHDLGFEGIQPYRMDVLRYLKHCTDRFDIVFADPPFRWPYTSELPGMILNSGILKPQGWFILEHPEQYSFTTIPELVMEKKYGPIRFSIFRTPE